MGDNFTDIDNNTYLGVIQSGGPRNLNTGDDLVGVVFLLGSDLTDAVFTGVDASGAAFPNCNLTDAVFTGATLTDTVMNGVIATGANFSNCSFGYGFGPGSIFDGATLTNANFTNITVTNLVAEYNFGLVFNQIIGFKCNFTGATLSSFTCFKAISSYSQSIESNFTNADFTNAVFTIDDGSTINFSSSTFDPSTTIGSNIDTTGIHPNGTLILPEGWSIVGGVLTYTSSEPASSKEYSSRYMNMVMTRSWKGIKNQKKYNNYEQYLLKVKATRV